MATPYFVELHKTLSFVVNYNIFTNLISLFTSNYLNPKLTQQLLFQYLFNLINFNHLFF